MMEVARQFSVDWEQVTRAVNFDRYFPTVVELRNNGFETRKVKKEIIMCYF